MTSVGWSIDWQHVRNVMVFSLCSKYASTKPVSLGSIPMVKTIGSVS